MKDNFDNALRSKHLYKGVWGNMFLPRKVKESLTQPLRAWASEGQSQPEFSSVVPKGKWKFPNTADSQFHMYFLFELADNSKDAGNDQCYNISASWDSSHSLLAL